MIACCTDDFFRLMPADIACIVFEREGIPEKNIRMCF